MSARSNALLAVVVAVPGGIIATSSAFAQSNAVRPSEDYSILPWIVIVGLILFFIPSYVAFWRKHPNRWPILLINFVFGGTGLGWFGSLIWACSAVHKSPAGSDGGESGLNLFVNDPQIVRIDGNVPVQATNADPVERLKRLKTLLDDGAISAEEYAGLRRPLLDQLMK